VSCPNASDGSLQLFVNGGVTPYHYAWDNGSTSNNLSNLSAGQYSVTVTDSNGCTATLDTSLEEPQPLSTHLTPSTFSGGYNLSCAGGQDGSIDTDVSGGASPYNFSWNKGAYNSQNPTGLSSGTYNLSLTDANGCTQRDSFTLNAPPPLDGDIQTQQPTCFGGADGSALIEVSGGAEPYDFLWSNGHTDSALSTLTSGDYTVTVNDANDCEYTESATVSEPSALSINMPKQDTINFGDTTQIKMNSFSNGNDASFQWSQEQSLSCYDCKEPNAYPLQTTDYTVTMTDADGCTTSETTRLVVVEDKTIFIPNSFTPDQNGLNDRFRVFTKGIESGKMKIFNRWGEKIYQTNQVLKGWDGTIQDSEAESGVYIYVVKLTYPDDTVEKRKGSVTIIR
jgi:gliding motility-associated-like protein